MNRRQRLEHLEQHNPIVFHREVEAFAAGTMHLDKDTIEDVIEQMYAEADVIDARRERSPEPYAQPGLPPSYAEIGVLSLIVVTFFIWACVAQ